jgi:cephalosporin-C deacetylase-like acetyl esterase
MQSKRFSSGAFIMILAIMLFSCVAKQELPVSKYYEYDHELPLNPSIEMGEENAPEELYHISYTSIHNKKVSGLLTIPNDAPNPAPVVILLHGLGDRKTVDYIEAGHQYFSEAGYAVFRIDIDNHGERKEYDYDFDLIDGYRYWTRDLVAQTVFDLRRAIDFLETRPDIDNKRIGFFGISLGGVIGTVFAGVDKRVKVPVIALAGGNLTLMFGIDAVSEDVRNFFSIIDPINFVENISPRPLLMINAENDEVIAPITSKMLFRKAKSPKEIKWYPSRHRDLPIEEAYPAGIQWFQSHL